MATSTSRAPAKPRTKRESATAATEFQIPSDEIAQRAYERFVARGFVHGFDAQDWFDAEDELRAEYRDQQ